MKKTVKGGKKTAKGGKMGYCLIAAALALLTGAGGAEARTMALTATVTSGTITTCEIFDLSDAVVGGDAPGSIARYKIAWTSDAGGNVICTIPMVGEVKQIVTDPGATAPTDNYDITLTDEAGFDVLGGGGANRDTANTEGFAPLISTYAPPIMCGTMTLTISTAGASKVGTLYVHVRR